MKSKWKLLKIKVGARKWKFLQKPVKNYRDGNDMGVAPWFSRTWQDYCSDMPWQVTRDSCPFLSTLAVRLVHPQGRSSLGSERWKRETSKNHSCVAAASVSAPWLPGAAEDMALSLLICHRAHRGRQPLPPLWPVQGPSPPPIQCTRIPVTKSACIWVHLLLFHSCWDWRPRSIAN